MDIQINSNYCALCLMRFRIESMNQNRWRPGLAAKLFLFFVGCAIRGRESFVRVGY